MKISRSILLLLSACYGAAAANTTVAVDSMDDFSDKMGTYGTTEFQLQNSIEYAGELTLPVPVFKGTSWVITSEDSARPANLYLNGGSYVVDTSNGSNNASNATYTITKLNNISISNYTGAEIEQGGASKVVGAFYSSATGQKFYLVENTGSLTFSNNTNVREQVDKYQKPQHLFLSSAVFTQLGSNYMGVYLDRNAGGVSFSDNKTAYLSKEPYEGSIFGQATTQQKKDENGDLVWQTDENGEVIWIEEKDAFGNLVYEKDENGKTMFDIIEDKDGKPVQVPVVSMVRVPVYETIVTDRFESSASTYSTVSGSCIFAPSGPTSISGNGGGVSFLRNSVINATGIATGGAISASAGTVTINDNQGGVEMHANSVLSTWVPDKPAISYHNQGGVISAQGATVELCGNGLRGTSGDSIRITDNEVRAMGNSNAARGGAIIADKLRISDNAGGIQILNNRVVSEYAGGSKHVTVVEGGAFYGSHGDNAFDISYNGGTVNIIGNYASALAEDIRVRGGFYSGYMKDIHIYSNKGNVSILDNYVKTGMSATEGVDHYSSAALGGAIYSLGLSIAGNEGDVVFRGNYEQTSDFTRLRSVVINSTLLDSVASRQFRISAVKDHSVTFYDSVYVAGSSADISFNAGNASLYGGMGDIIFTGEQTIADLEKIKKDAATQEEILASRTSVFEADATIYGGRLIVKDGAIYRGKNLTAERNSGAVVRVNNATLDNSDYTLTFNMGTTLELEGANTVSGNIMMESGSCLHVVYSKEMETQAAMTLTGNLTFGDRNIVIKLSNFEDQKGSYKLIDQTGALRDWAQGNITLLDSIGAALDFNRLVWEGNVLYYNIPIVDLVWNNQGDGKWNNISTNWNNSENGQTENAYKENVYFGSTGGTAETVELEGNMHVTNMTVQNGGSYVYTEGDSGASLSVHGTMTVEAGAKVDVQLSEGLLVNKKLNSAGDFKAEKITGTGSVAVTGGSLELADDTDALAVEGDVSITNTELRGTWTADGLDIGDSHVIEKANITLKNANITSTVETSGTLKLDGQTTVQQGGSVVLKGGNLILTSSIDHASAVVIDVKASGQLTLESGATISRSELSGVSKDHVVTLQGAGKLNLGAKSDFTGYQLGENWQGTVKLQGISNGNLQLGTLGQAGSTIELENCYGYTGVNEGKVEANIHLTKSYDADNVEQAAFVVNDGYSSSDDADYVMTTFAGKVSGAGKIKFDKTLTGTTGFKFTGDVSEWNGSFEKSTGNEFNLVFSGDASDIAADIKKSGGKSLVLKLESDKDMSLSGDITTDSIKIDKTNKVEFSGAVVTGNVNISNGADIVFNGNGVTSSIGSITDATLTGKLIKNGSDTLLLQGSKYNIGSIVVNEGTLEVQQTNGNTRSLQSNITVNSGATLKFGGENVADILYHNNKIDTKAYYSLTVDGGTVDFGKTRQTIGEWSITLKNNAEMTGTGAEYGSDYTAAMDVHENTTIKVASGTENKISANIRLRWKVLTFDVDPNASVDLSGRIHYDINDYAGDILKTGEGNLTISSQAMLSYITTKQGVVTLSYTGEGGNKVKNLDASIGSTAKGTLHLEDNVKLTVTEGFWASQDSSIELEKDAELAYLGMVFTNTAEEKTAVLKSVNDGSNKYDKYGLDKTNFILENGHIKSIGTDGTTLGNKLARSSVENAGGGLLTVTHEENDISGIYATGGDVLVENVKNLYLDKLVIAADRTIKAANVVVSELTAEAGSTLKIDQLKLTSGAMVDLGGSVSLDGGALTLQAGVQLSDAMLSAILGLEEGETIVLFTDVTNLEFEKAVTFRMRSLAQQTMETTEAEATISDKEVAAGEYFSNLSGNSGLVLSYDSTAGTVSITQTVPEPTTTTLGLLAVAGLAMRRRRRH